MFILSAILNHIGLVCYVSYMYAQHYIHIYIYIFDISNMYTILHCKRKHVNIWYIVDVNDWIIRF